MLHTKYCMQQTRFPKPYAANRLIPYPWIFGTITERFFWKKSRIIVGDVTVGTLKMKIRCTNRLSVGLSYEANFKWHMPICVERCHAKQNYMPFFWTITERAFRKKFQSTGTYTNAATIRSEFFPAKRARWRVQWAKYFTLLSVSCLLLKL